jgi:hypothetical protein
MTNVAISRPALQLQQGAVAGMGPSVLLMRQCLDIGVLPTFYVSIERQHA